MRDNSVSYGASARPAWGGDPATSQLAAGTARAVEYGLDPAYCGHIKDDGFQCGARPAKSSGLCIGHLRTHAVSD